MKKIINCILSFTLCAVLSVFAFFQFVDATEIEATDFTITNASTMETELLEVQKEISNNECINGTGLPNIKNSEPNGKCDEF